ncbi:MAG: aminotransferase DegT [Clostridiales bacterium GWE2_32_10]|nr:MAG: aminotransferase DegT [Clostridiales bacterium GWE2_32_10]HBY20921.1 aminotransferase DegT [Clostridiales bacterium]
MAIQLFVPTFRVEECLSEIRECLEKGWTGMGFKTVEFENKWKEYTGYENAHFLNSATAGLHLAVKVLKEQLGWTDDDEIITTPLTFVSTNHAILYENLNPVFADVDEYLCLDPADVKSKITANTKAIVFVGMGGNIGRYYDIVELCKEYDLKLILDAAHMSGTKYAGDTVGKEADVTVYSFQAVKNLPTGDSGMICFKDKSYDDIVRKYSWMGINKDTYSRSGSAGTYKWEYNVDHLGYKYNGNSIMAAMGLVGLKYLDQDNAYRRQLATWYNNNFKEYTDKIKTIPVPDKCETSNHLYIIEVGNRDELLEKLNEHEIYPGVHYKNNIEYSLYDYAKDTCPNTDRISHKILSLPMHMRLTKADVDYVAEICLRYAK